MDVALVHLDVPKDVPNLTENGRPLAALPTISRIATSYQDMETPGQPTPSFTCTKREFIIHLLFHDFSTSSKIGSKRKREVGKFSWKHYGAITCRSCLT